MAVFSTIIDELLSELVRPDMINMLPGFFNQTIRECHVGVESKMPMFFDENRHEVEIIPSSATDGVYVWSIPTVNLFQAIDAVFYTSVNRYANLTSPQVINDHIPTRPNDAFCYYRTGPFFALRGFGQPTSKIKISWFEYPRSLVYYPVATRPLIYNHETMTYSQPASPSLSLEEAKTRSTNWLIERHAEMLKEGVKAKAYARMDQQFRASTSYSKYLSALLGMQNTESAPQGIYKFR